MTSIITNTAAMSALQTLRSIGQGMEQTQSRVSSGLKVGTASDNAAYWSIATTMRSDNASLSAVQDAIGLGAAKVDTAYAGMESAIDVVKTIQQKLVAATEEGVDKSKIQEEITQLQDQLKSIASSASFSGENWLQANLGGTAESLKKSVVASFVRTDDAVSVKRISHELSSTSVLFDTNTAAGVAKAGILDSTLKLDEKRTTIEITTAKPVTATGEALVKGGSVPSVTAGIEEYTTAGGELYIRQFDDAGVQQRDASGKDLWVKVATAAGTPPNDIAAGTSTAATPSTTYFVVTAPVVEKVTVAATTAAKLTDAGATITPTTGNVTVGTDTYIKLGADDTWVKATVHATGTDEYEDGVKGTAVGTNYYKIDQTNTKIAGALGEVDTDAGVSVADLDITKLGDLATKLGYTEKEVLDKLIQHVADQYKTMTSAAADLGSVKMRIGLQEDFVSKLTDSIDSGVGRLVDAEMNEESTRLKALQTQQQLAVQALSIANSSSESILSLFR